METIKLKEHLPVLDIAKVNLKHNSVLSVSVSIAMLIITPIIFGTANLDKAAASVPLEMFICLVGIVMLTPIFQPEQNNEIAELVFSKYISTNIVYFIRTFCAVALLILFICIFGIYMKMHSCEVYLGLIIGTIANAIFLGSLGMITSALTENTIIAYMIPLVYYVINYGSGSRLGNFYLFSLRTLDFRPKIWLIIVGILLIFLSLIIERLKNKF